MDKLEEAKQESESDKLQEQPEEILEEVYQPCIWINERGKRVGQACGRKAFDGNKHCSVHQAAQLQREPIPETKESAEVIDQIRSITDKYRPPYVEEVIVKVKASEQNLEVKSMSQEQNLDVLAKIRSLNEEIARLDEEERLKKETLRSKIEDIPKRSKKDKVDSKYYDSDILEIMRNYSRTMTKLSELLTK
jgi:hypothetical protein